jgi:hypothetical protein
MNSITDNILSISIESVEAIDMGNEDDITNKFKGLFDSKNNTC